MEEQEDIIGSPKGLGDPSPEHEESAKLGVELRNLITEAVLGGISRVFDLVGTVRAEAGEREHRLMHELQQVTIYLFNLKTELATWGGIGGGGKFWLHASCASAHITFAALAGLAGGGGGRDGC